MSTQVVAQVFTFASSSGSGSYETLVYTDGTHSCNCPGWTRRVAADGSRSCKHTRLVDQGIAEANCVSHHDYEAVVKQPTPKFNGTKSKEDFNRKLGERKFFLK